MFCCGANNCCAHACLRTPCALCPGFGPHFFPTPAVGAGRHFGPARFIGFLYTPFTTEYTGSAPHQKSDSFGVGHCFLDHRFCGRPHGHCACNPSAAAAQPPYRFGRISALCTLGPRAIIEAAPAHPWPCACAATACCVEKKPAPAITLLARAFFMLCVNRAVCPAGRGLQSGLRRGRQRAFYRNQRFDGHAHRREFFFVLGAQVPARLCRVQIARDIAQRKPAFFKIK